MNYVIEQPTFTVLLIMASVIIFINILLYKLKTNIDYLLFANVFLLFIALIEPSPSDYIFISLLIYSIKDKKFSYQKYSKMRLEIWLILSFMAVTAMSLPYINDYYIGFRFFGITLYLMVYSLLIFFNTDQKNYINILRVYIISSTLAACLGILGYLGFFTDYLLFDSYRVKSLFKDPNVFGAFLTPAVILLIGDHRSRIFLPKGNKKLEKIKLVKYLSYVITPNTLLIVINIIGIVISYSRGAWVSLATGILILMLMNLKRIDLRKLSLYLGAIISIGLLLWYKVFSIATKSFFLERLSIRAYDSDRFAVQYLGFSKALDHVFGYGPGQYEHVMLRVMGEEYSAHSLYARIIFENGIFGFTLLVLAFVIVIIKLFRVRKIESHLKINSVYIAILVSLLVNSLVIDTLHWRHLWLFYGLSMSYLNSYQPTLNHSLSWKEVMELLEAHLHKLGKDLKAVFYLLIRNLLALIGMLLYTNSRNDQEIVILMYHRVNNRIDQAIAVKEERFGWQMEYLKKKGYIVLSMDEAYQKIKDKNIDKKYIVLTFDDGYEDFYEKAYPILMKYNYPVILYLVPGYIETDKVFTWDQDPTQSKLLNWEQIKELKGEPFINFGSHTLNHYDVKTLDITTLRNELEESKKILEEKLETKIIHFAYPKGIYDESTEKILKEFYETGVLIYQGVTINNRIEPENYFRLKRMPIYRSDNRFMFIARLKGFTRLEEIVRKKFKGD